MPERLLRWDRYALAGTSPTCDAQRRHRNTMREHLKITSGALLSTALLLVAGCSSDDAASPAPSAGASSGSARGPGGAGPGGQGGPGGGGQQITAVNLNTDGVSPGGANTAAVVQATNAFLATLDATKRRAVAHPRARTVAARLAAVPAAGTAGGPPPRPPPPP